MAVYKYTGYTINGKKVKATRKADDELRLKLDLKAEGVTLTTCDAIGEKRKSDFFAVSSHVKKSEFISFCQQFAILITAGCSLTEALNTLRHQEFGTVFKNVISEVYEDVLKGGLLSASFRKHTKIFPDFFCSMVYIGEITGSLSRVLTKTSEYYERDRLLKNKIKSSMIYPIFLCIIVFAVTLLLMLFVVPMFRDMLSDYDMELPTLTKVVMDISDFLVNNFLIILIALVVLIVGIFLGLRTKPGKYLKGYLGMHIPLFRKINMNIYSSRFSLSLDILLNSGMQVIDAIKEMPVIMGSEYFSRKFVYVINEVNNGMKLSRAMENSGLFPVLLIQMIAVGEDTSTLEECMHKTGDFFSDNLQRSMTKAASLFEPTVIVFMGAIVGIIILSVMLPIFQLNNAPLA